MKLKSIVIQNFRSFVSMQDPLEFGDITVLIGPNNVGKTSIIKAISFFQEGLASGFSLDCRDTRRETEITLYLEKGNLTSFGLDKEIHESSFSRMYIKQLGAEVISISYQDASIGTGLNRCNSNAPHHAFIPFFSKRKVGSYTESVQNFSGKLILPSLSNFAQKLVGLPASNPSYKIYSTACEQVLGFTVCHVESIGGVKPGAFFPDGTPISIEQMGEGVANIAAFLYELAVSKEKIFLIEEPENDLHPNALKALLDLIIESSKNNQFIISTHSNIVLSHLGAEPSTRLYEIKNKSNSFPVDAEVKEISKNPEDRFRVLNELGYAFTDYQLWDGWLFLEESSAEIIIKKYLIPWFVPALKNIRTLSAAGVSNVEPLFRDFSRLVLFTHLESVYKNKTWVLVDGDDKGKEIVKKLKHAFKDWPMEKFNCFQEVNFEKYYPAFFSDRIVSTLSITDKEKKRIEKKQLLQDVCSWLDLATDNEKKELKSSANEVINYLKTIKKELSL